MRISILILRLKGLRKLGSSFGPIFYLFPMKVDGARGLSCWGTCLALGLQWHKFLIIHQYHQFSLKRLCDSSLLQFVYSCLITHLISVLLKYPVTFLSGYFKFNSVPYTQPIDCIFISPQSSSAFKIKDGDYMNSKEQ